jgi:hypothetical protein
MPRVSDALRGFPLSGTTDILALQAVTELVAEDVDISAVIR